MCSGHWLKSATNEANCMKSLNWTYSTFFSIKLECVEVARIIFHSTTHWFCALEHVWAIAMKCVNINLFLKLFIGIPFAILHQTSGTRTIECTGFILDSLTSMKTAEINDRGWINEWITIILIYRLYYGGNGLARKWFVIPPNVIKFGLTVEKLSFTLF